MMSTKDYFLCRLMIYIIIERKSKKLYYSTYNIGSCYTFNYQVTHYTLTYSIHYITTFSNIIYEVKE